MIDYAYVSEIGEKEKNEDSVKVFMNEAISTYGFALADGLGGHGNGDIASKFVLDSVAETVEGAEYFSNVIIDQCFDTAQHKLMEEKENSGLHSIKTTMVLLLINENTAQWGYVGDSRLYHFRGGNQLSRTIDHSVPQMLVLSGQIKEKDIRRHPDRSALLRAMGAEWDSPAYEISQRGLEIAKGDTFLLCSDGFWEWIEEKTMIKILKKNLSVHDTLLEMVNEVKKNGIGKGMDNYSAVLVSIK